MDSTQTKAGSLEQFLKGEPLTEELAALKRGDERDEDFRSSVPELSPSVVRSLDDDDREHLRRLKLEPGWTVMLQLLDNDIRHQENLAKEASMNDPLGNREQVANAWAYIAMLQRAKNRIIMLIDEQIAKLTV